MTPPPEIRPAARFANVWQNSPVFANAWQNRKTPRREICQSLAKLTRFCQTLANVPRQRSALLPSSFLLRRRTAAAFLLFSLPADADGFFALRED